MSSRSKFMKRGSPAFAVFFASSVILLQSATGCSDGTNSQANNQEEENIATAQGALVASLNRVGALPESPELLKSKMRASTAATSLAALPASVDLSAKVPRPGNQNPQGSCVGWAVGYAEKTLQEVTEMKWPPYASDHAFSASWVYNQINGGKDNGSSVSDALNLLVNKGADTISSFPYNPADFLTQPNAASLARAAHYKAASWNTLPVTALDFKTTLAGGNAVVVAFNVLPDMDLLIGGSNTSYDTSAGTRASFTTTCSASTVAACNGTCNGVGKCGTCNTSTGVCTVPACTVAPCSRGGHAVAIVGYDDATQQFLFINSWGDTWNGNGYAKFAYSFITNSSLAMGAFVLVDKANVPGLQDSTMTWYESHRPSWW